MAKNYDTKPLSSSSAMAMLTTAMELTSSLLRPNHFRESVSSSFSSPAIKISFNCPPTCARRYVPCCAKGGSPGGESSVIGRAKEFSKRAVRGGSKRQKNEKLEVRETDGIQLSDDQAIGRIVSAQANFMRVVVERAGGGIGSPLVGISSSSEKLTNYRESGNGYMTPPENGKSRIGMELLCVVRAVLKKIKHRVLVGDRVLVSGVDWTDSRGMIEEVLDRKTEISDPPVANADQMLILFAMDRPKLEPLSLSRFLVEAESTGIPFHLVLNKADLVEQQVFNAVRDQLLSWGYKPYFCSVATQAGIMPIAKLLANRTSAIIGPSGVGKSSLINVLCDAVGIKSIDLPLQQMEYIEDEMKLDKYLPNQVQKGSSGFDEQAVGDVSERTGRGKHTTRNITLLKLPTGGYLTDTPGFNQPDLSKVTRWSLPQCFPEVRIAQSEFGSCAFSDCLHVGEPGCIVGGDWERYPHYLQLLEEVKKREDIEIRTFGTKKESEVRYKVIALGMKQAEPRLQLKKHRRLSRNQAKQNFSVELEEEAGDKMLGRRGVSRNTE